jgi:nucleoside phosphorylase
MPKPKHPPRILLGAMASGASVLQSSDAVSKVLRQHKDVLAIEMEAFSIMFAAQTAPLPRPLPIVAKSVCDNGDGKKNDKFQEYAAYTSSRVFQEFALRYLVTQDTPPNAF